MSLFPDQAQSPDIPPPRCARCFYRIDGQTVPTCPECGKTFDPDDPTTFTRKPPFVFWTFWFPGFALAAGTSIFWTLLFGLGGSIGFGLSVATPFAAGAILGYGVKLARIPLILLVLFLLAFVITMLIAMHPVAAVCIIILGVVSLIPIASGVAVGLLLKHKLKSSSFSQKQWLPLLFLSLSPALVEFLQRAFIPPPAEETVTTSLVLPMSAVEAFDRWIFYEDVPGDPPLLLRLGLPIPVKTQGAITKAGDIKVCLYKNGRLVKRVTEFEPGKRIAFDVIQQHHIQDHAIRLTSGSFDFAPTPDGKCQVTLTTRYQPLMTPRIAWRPAETLIAHTLHQHVLHGMDPSDPPPVPHPQATP